MDDEEESPDFADLSEEELKELSEQIVDEVPEAMTQTLGLDFFADVDEEEQEEVFDEMEERLQEWFLQLQDVEEAESSDELVQQVIEIYESILGGFRVQWEGEDGDDERGGLEWLLDTQWETFEGSREALDELGYVEYFDLIEGLALDIIDEGKYDRVEEFYDENVKGSDNVQAMLQRMMGPMVFEHLEYVDDHPEITERDEAEEYLDMYHELAGLYEKLLPQFVGVLEIYNESEPNYEHLNTMNLGNLMKKAESDQFQQYSTFAEGFNREIRNSIAHREYTFDPVEEQITFRNQGEVVAELSYEEVQEVVWEGLAVVQSLWIFRSLLQFHRLQLLEEYVEELRRGDRG